MLKNNKMKTVEKLVSIIVLWALPIVGAILVIKNQLKKELS